MFHQLLQDIGFDSKMISARVYNPEKKILVLNLTT
ncbi:arylamine N-acetyltransferase [Halosquirtibacter xylanolyticus]|nr:arylamine N-acetyltransferase [Prolixibacteraceae bacterium]